jgi:hypothetical protein
MVYLPDAGEELELRTRVEVPDNPPPPVVRAAALDVVARLSVVNGRLLLLAGRRPSFSAAPPISTDVAAATFSAAGSRPGSAQPASAAPAGGGGAAGSSRGGGGGGGGERQWANPGALLSAEVVRDAEEEVARAAAAERAAAAAALQMRERRAAAESACVAGDSGEEEEDEDAHAERVRWRGAIKLRVQAAGPRSAAAGMWAMMSVTQLPARPQAATANARARRGAPPADSSASGGLRIDAYDTQTTETLSTVIPDRDYESLVRALIAAPPAAAEGTAGVGVGGGGGRGGSAGAAATRPPASVTAAPAERGPRRDARRRELNARRDAAAQIASRIFISAQRRMVLAGGGGFDSGDGPAEAKGTDPSSALHSPRQQSPMPQQQHPRQAYVDHALGPAASDGGYGPGHRVVFLGARRLPVRGTDADGFPIERWLVFVTTVVLRDSAGAAAAVAGTPQAQEIGLVICRIYQSDSGTETEVRVCPLRNSLTATSGISDVIATIALARPLFAAATPRSS